MIYDTKPDLRLLSLGHGWSAASLILPEQTHEYRMTHVFDDPLEAIARATRVLLEGANEVRFVWRDEPGSQEFILSRLETERHVITVSVREYSSIFGNSDSTLVAEYAFNVSARFWGLLVLGEFMKLRYIFADRDYRDAHATAELPLAEIDAIKALLPKLDGEKERHSGRPR